MTHLVASQPTSPAEPVSADAHFRPPARAIFILEILLIVLAARLFHLEERRGLFPLLIITAIGWLATYGRSALWRMRAFLAISILALPLALGWPVASVASWSEAARIGVTQAAVVLGLGLVLIGACHLPVGYRWRLAIIILLGGGLVAWRSQDGSLFWPVLGSIFMFRLWIYLRAMPHAPTANLTQRLSYFFMLPNAFFPFFPIVDYRVWIAGVAEQDQALLAQRGIAWITRGMVHLLIYRVIELAFLPAPQDLVNAGDVAIFMAANYGLYLRISGHFHIITGILLLFGFNLPRTHDWYFLASNLNDIWRRINIYWKDFLNSHVFLPAFFALRGVPRSLAIGLAVLLTFLATWVLHSWQAFWLLGDFPLSANVALLWIGAGGLVAVSSLWQYHRARQGKSRSAATTLSGAFQHVLGIVATFTAVSFFWACWTDASFPRRLRDIAATGGFAPEYSFEVLLVLAGIVLAGTLVAYFAGGRRWTAWREVISLETSPAACILCLMAVATAGLPHLDRFWGREIAIPLAKLRRDAPTILGASKLAEGYYQELAEAHLQTEALMVQAGVSGGQGPENYFDATRRTNAARVTELIPHWHGTIKGLPFTVNRWGMRDADVTLPKPAGTYRVAVLGSSVTLGLGVRANKDFESLLEARFNAASSDRDYEFLNFAVGSYYILHSLANLRERALDFNPDAVIYVAHQGEMMRADVHLAMMYHANRSELSDCLREVIDRAGVTPEDSPGMMQIRLQPYARQIVACGYGAMVAECRARGIRPIFVYFPVPNAPAPPALGREIIAMARAAGFEVIDLSGWLEDGKPDEFALGADDYHLNAAGHEAIAERLWGELGLLEER